MKIRGSSSWIAYYPAHVPRSKDPHYAYFRISRKLLIASGKGCWRCGGHTNLEAHHSIIEYALLNGIDINKAMQDFPSIHDHESFLIWAEGPENLELLCRECHRGKLGIHSMPYPLWVGEKWAKDNIHFLLPSEIK